MPTFKDPFDAFDRFFSAERFEVLWVRHMHANVRLQRDDDRMIANVLDEAIDDQEILQEAEAETVEVENRTRS